MHLQEKIEPKMFHDPNNDRFIIFQSNTELFSTIHRRINIITSQKCFDGKNWNSFQSEVMTIMKRTLTRCFRTNEMAALRIKVAEGSAPSSKLVTDSAAGIYRTLVATAIGGISTGIAALGTFTYLIVTVGRDVQKELGKEIKDIGQKQDKEMEELDKKISIIIGESLKKVFSDKH